MLFALVIIALASISVLLAVWSLRGELKKHPHEQQVKQELQKGRVLFYAPERETKKEE